MGDHGDRSAGFGRRYSPVGLQPAERRASVPFAFAGPSSFSLIALSGRVLDDAPLVGTGAGTFVALAPIYREIDDSPPCTGATAAAALAIELGKPMFWLIVAATVGSISALSRATLTQANLIESP
jgi:hypothetical protein